MKHTSKLPHVGTTIFSAMSKLAKKHNALNLAQGFPGYKTDPKLHKLLNDAIVTDAYNQYAPMEGSYKLRTQITSKINTLYGSNYQPDTDITITSGATQAIFTAIAAFVRPLDEVIVLKPAYDCYEPAIAVQGGVAVQVQLLPPNFDMDWGVIKNAISSKTKMIIINTPHNPTGTVWDSTDMLKLQALLEGTNIIVLSDEVYEHIVFDCNQHQSVAKFPDLAKRTLITASFGKTFHITGWKIGYCVGPKSLMEEFQKVHQFNVYSVHHPTQRALATYLENPITYLELNQFFEEKRDLFLAGLQASRFEFKPTSGTYFQLLDFSQISTKSDVEFSRELTIQNKLASIPISVFNTENKDFKMLRFCFAKTDDDLKRASEILCSI